MSSFLGYNFLDENTYIPYKKYNTFFYRKSYKKSDLTRSKLKNTGYHVFGVVYFMQRHGRPTIFFNCTE